MNVRLMRKQGRTASYRRPGRLARAGASCVLAAGVARADVVFTDVTAAAGVVYQQRAVPVTAALPPEAAEKPTGGAAAGDYDRDGWVDLVVTRADAPPILFRNRGDGTFADVTATAGDIGTAVPTGSNGVVWGDVDDDGDLDLYMTAFGTTRFFLFVNQGDGTFIEEAVARGAALADAYPHFGMGAAMGDFDRDGYLDLFVAEWWAHPLYPTNLLPGTSRNRLLRNRGATAPGTFEDVTEAFGVALESFPEVATSVLGTPGFSPGFVDFDDDGWPDLTWVADWGNSRIFWNDGGARFVDGTVTAGTGRERSGMGSTQDDFDGDGRIDWYTTSIFGREDEIQYGVSNQLYRNDGDRTFTVVTETAGVADGGFGWGATSFDFDHDGDVDIVATNGFIELGHPEEERWATDRTRVFANQGGLTFTEVGESLGVTDAGLGRAVLTFDYDRDGDLDVFLTNHAGTPILYRNDGGNAAPWLELTLEGVESNRDGIGAVVRVDPRADVQGDEQVRHLLANSNFVSIDELLVHVGLGAHQGPIDVVEIRWPSGAVQRLTNVPASARVHVVEAASPLQVSFGASSLTVTEGGGAAAVQIVVSGADTTVLGERSVDVGVAGGTAVVGEDAEVPSHVIIPAGDYRSPTAIDVGMTLLDDGAQEPDETLLLSLVGNDLVNVPEDGASLAVTIVDDDEATCETASAARLVVTKARLAVSLTLEGVARPLAPGPVTLTVRGKDGALPRAIACDVGTWSTKARSVRFVGSDEEGAYPRLRIRAVTDRRGRRTRIGASGRAEAPLPFGLLAKPVVVRLDDSDGRCWSVTFDDVRLGRRLKARRR